MKKVIFTLLFLSSCTAYVMGQSGPRSIGLGNASSTLEDAWASVNNPAGLASLTNIQVGLAYQSFARIGKNNLVVVLPTNSGVFALSASNFGITDYSVNNYGLSYGRKLGENFNIGAKINYLQIRQSPAYGNWNTVTGQVGLSAHITDKLSLGAQIINPVTLSISDKSEEKLSPTLQLGVAYKFSESVLAIIDVSKDSPSHANVGGGLEYAISDKLDLRAGLNTYLSSTISPPITSSFGIGLNLGKFEFDMGVNHHQFLGFNPSIALTLHLDKKGKE